MASSPDPRLAAVIQALRADLGVQAVYTVALLDIASLARTVLRAVDALKPEPPMSASLGRQATSMAVAIYDPNSPDRQRKARLLDQPSGREPFRPSRQPVKNAMLLTKSNTSSITLIRDDDPRVLVTMPHDAITFKVGDLVRVFADGVWGDWRVRSIDRDTDITRDVVLGPVG